VSNLTSLGFFAVYYRTWSTNTVTPRIIRTTQCDLSLYPDSRKVSIRGEKLKLPESNTLGKAPVCDHCVRQLDCLGGKEFVGPMKQVNSITVPSLDLISDERGIADIKRDFQ
jgi:hypothetical protein